MPPLHLSHFFSTLLAFAGAAFVTWFSIPVVVRVTSLKHLTDTPGKRKVHVREIPTLGGVAIFAGFVSGFLLSIDEHMAGVTYFTVAMLLLFFAGMKDDLITLDPKKKLFAVILAATCLIYFTDIRITNFHGFLGINEVPVWVTYVSTIFVMIVIVNAVNLIDGIDGLAATTSIISTCLLGFWFMYSGNLEYAIMAASLIGALAAFLRFNLSGGSNKIFMGDTGSLIIGFLLAAMTIRFNEINVGQHTWHDLHSAPAISIAILVVPLFDTLRVFTIRIARKQHPFTADNRHIHHMMLRAGFTHKETDIMMGSAHIMLIALAFAIDHSGIFSVSLVLFVTCLLLTGLIYLRIYNRFLLHRMPVSEEDYDVIRTMAVMHAHISGRGIRMPVFVPKYENIIKSGVPGNKDVLAGTSKGVKVEVRGEKTGVRREG